MFVLAPLPLLEASGVLVGGKEVFSDDGAGESDEGREMLPTTRSVSLRSYSFDTNMVIQDVLCTVSGGALPGVDPRADALVTVLRSTVVEASADTTIVCVELKLIPVPGRIRV